MKLIADSGSSKTDWRIIDENQEIHQAKTMGLNPYHVSDEGLISELKEVLVPRMKEADLDPETVSEIYFYGAGCVAGEPVDRVRQSLERVFPGAVVEVRDDLIAVARGLCGREAGIVSILGTGSNSGLYDGEKIAWKITSLGYILGDEGSGTWIGKSLLAKYLRGELSDILKERFENRYDSEAGEIFEQVYRTPMASRYLAGFSRFVFQNITDPLMYQMVYEGFRLFFEHNILKYPDYKSVKVHFSGSVGFYFANVLRQAASDLSVQVGHVVEGPIAGLALFHR